MRPMLKDNFGLIDIHNSKLFRARLKARGGSNEVHIQEYKYLICYTHMVHKTNPGSVVVVASEAVGDPLRFKRIFICLEACYRGFTEGCRG